MGYHCMPYIQYGRLYNMPHFINAHNVRSNEYNNIHLVFKPRFSSMRNPMGPVIVIGRFISAQNPKWSPNKESITPPPAKTFHAMKTRTKLGV